MTYQIKKNNLKWRNSGWVKLNPNAVTGVALHHMAHPTADLETVHDWHLARWNNEPGAGYNYFVTLEGEIIEARGDHRGAHTGGHNSSLLGIGFQGNYHPIKGVAHRTSMPDKQYNAGVWLIKELQKKYPQARRVHGHKHWTATACPGDFFPLVEMLGGKYRGQAQPVQQPTAPAAAVGTYTVKAGDTLGRIAAANGTTTEELAKLNGLSNPDLIRVGQEIKLPVTTYTVKAGDTLGRIAQQHNTTVEALAQLNGISNPDRISVGQVLKVAGTPAAAPKPTPQPEPKPSTNVPAATLRPGTRSAAVGQLQRALNTHSPRFNPGAIDNSYGPKTQDAVKRYQMYYGVRPFDGIYGPLTAAKLRETSK